MNKGKYNIFLPNYKRDLDDNINNNNKEANNLNDN